MRYPKIRPLEASTPTQHFRQALLGCAWLLGSGVSLPAWVAAEAPPTVVLLVEEGTDAELADAVEQAIAAQLAGTPVRLRKRMRTRVAFLDLSTRVAHARAVATRTGALALYYLKGAQPTTATLVLVDPARGRTAVRTLSFETESLQAAAEAAGIIARDASMAILQAGSAPEAAPQGPSGPGTAPPGEPPATPDAGQAADLLIQPVPSPERKPAVTAAEPRPLPQPKPPPSAAAPPAAADRPPARPAESAAPPPLPSAGASRPSARSSGRPQRPPPPGPARTPPAPHSPIDHLELAAGAQFDLVTPQAHLQPGLQFRLTYGEPAGLPLSLSIEGTLVLKALGAGTERLRMAVQRLPVAALVGLRLKAQPLAFEAGAGAIMERWRRSTTLGPEIMTADETSVLTRYGGLVRASVALPLGSSLALFLNLDLAFFTRDLRYTGEDNGAKTLLAPHRIMPRSAAGLVVRYP